MLDQVTFISACILFISFLIYHPVCSVLLVNIVMYMRSLHPRLIHELDDMSPFFPTTNQLSDLRKNLRNSAYESTTDEVLTRKAKRIRLLFSYSGTGLLVSPICLLICLALSDYWVE